MDRRPARRGYDLSFQSAHIGRVLAEFATGRCAAASSESRILVVDDEPAMRRILKVNLASAGYIVHEAASGDEAIRAVSTVDPDLVLLDLGLPDIDGSRVVAQIR